MAPATEHYVDNKTFLEELKRYRTDCLKAKRKNKTIPQLSEYLGECFLKIATRLSYRPNFMGYSYRDDMVMDGVENCLVYIHNFDPEKGKNPFSYFTTIIWYAFLRRIQREKRHQYVKYKLMEKNHIEGTLASDVDGQTSSDDSIGAGMLSFENIQDFIRRFDEYSTKRRARRRQGRTATSPRVNRHETTALEDDL